MALYAFNGTWNEDLDDPDKHTNVVAFCVACRRQKPDMVIRADAVSRMRCETRDGKIDFLERPE